MKEDKGFTLVELIVAMAILTLVAVPILKSFAVATKVNAKSYEKDKANIIVTDKIETIKKNPYDFLNKLEAKAEAKTEAKTEVKAETRYYKSLFNGAYYHNLRKDGTFDGEGFRAYVKNYFAIFPRNVGWDKDAKIHQVSCETSYKTNGIENKSLYYDKETFKDLLNRGSTDLSKIKSIINKCNITEYYDSNWEVTTDKASAKYEAQIDVSRKAENHATPSYTPETLFKNNERYDVPFMEKYFAVLKKNEDGEDNKDSNYALWIFYNYSREEFESDFNKIYPTPKQGDLVKFLNALQIFQSSSGINENSASYGECYIFFRENKRAKFQEGACASRVKLQVDEKTISIPVRIDFDARSIKPMYNVEVYNMTDKSMELYIVHNGNNNSEVNVKVSKGTSKTTEVYTTKNIVNTVYKMDVKVIRKQDNYTLINYKTEKCVPGEEAQDFNFVSK